MVSSGLSEFLFNIIIVERRIIRIASTNWQGLYRNNYVILYNCRCSFGRCCTYCSHGDGDDLGVVYADLPTVPPECEVCALAKDRPEVVFQVNSHGRWVSWDGIC